jgi:parallel beta-helix repeat protein
MTAAAFTGSAPRVTIKELTIEKYASPAQSGAVDGSKGSGWTVARNVIRWNHGAGLSLGSSMQVRDNHVLANGQLGVGGGDDYSGIVIEGNEIAYNNEAGFDWQWEAGGSKFWATTDLVVRENHVHHNLGPGLWTDTDNRGTLYEGNVVEDNSVCGIFHEISYAAVVRNNTVRRNGFAHSTWVWGAGILVAASSDVEIYGNIVEDNAGGINAVQQERGVGKYGPHVVRNLWVHDNTVRMRTGLNGIATDTGDLSIFRNWNNRYDSNTYYLGPLARYFAWLGARTEAEWRSDGQDVRGAFYR